MHLKGEQTGSSGGPGTKHPLGVQTAWGAASAVVAVLIIVVITPTAPSVARAITTNTVVFWILPRFNILQKDI
jgi:hypothetical protein